MSNGSLARASQQAIMCMGAITSRCVWAKACCIYGVLVQVRGARVEGRGSRVEGVG